ncbi:Uncharacterized protein OnM2_039033 [Erysiphe neolycopersici]|uniref:Nudix hydrolase domain-containing protein n=1 Tax=Erysiphe neolycopersici TaxID=212602 RepID=A0A420HW51_9PEZI|nr:Uncharacterized protein OnM2_039033 [Erysiphe neolycopersici]
MPLQTYLELVKKYVVLSDSTTKSLSSTLSRYYVLIWKNTIIGYLSEAVIDALIALPQEIRDVIHVNICPSERKISLFQDISTLEARTAAAAILCGYWRKNRTFKVLDGWRSELYPVYGPGNELLWSIERSASALFGIVTYGVHLTAYTRDSNASCGLNFWVPRRAASKQTYSGMLDNTVAGGMAVGEEPLDCLVREAAEEAGLQENLVRNHAKACGTVTYTYVRDEKAGGEVGLVQPECQFVYDLELPEGVVPIPTDGEVETFYLWRLEDVQAALLGEEFKPNCALVLLDFFIRWKIMTEENEPDYKEIKRRLHCNLNLCGPHILH